MEALQRQIASGEIVALVDHRPETFARADALLAMARSLKAGRDALSSSEHLWTEQTISLLRRVPDDEAICALEAKRPEAEALLEENRYFLSRPVELPADAIDDDKLIGAIADLAGGGTGLGLVAGLFAGQLKMRLASIRILGEKPRTTADWMDVRRFVTAQQQAKRLKVAWNHAAAHSSLSPIDVDGLIGVRPLLAQLNQLGSIREHIALENRVAEDIASVAPRWSKPVQAGSEAIAALLDMLETHALRRRLERAGEVRRSMVDLFAKGGGELGARFRGCLQADLGSQSITTSDFRHRWADLRNELSEILALGSAFETVARVTRLIEESGAPTWARQLRTEAVDGVEDPLTPGDWARRWRLRQLDGWLSRIDRHGRLHRLATERVESETLLKTAYERSIEQRTWLKLSNRATDKVRAALAAYATAVRRIGRGTGKSAARHRRDARDASDRAKGALPCWIMPHYRVSESLPSDFGLFDLVIVDEASQSTLAALPALMRAEQILIVGDDKQVSPEHVGLDQERADTLAHRHLDDQVPDYRRQLRQENSLYDLGQVVFAGGRLMLKEHFRCVAPIIEFSKAQFYAHELMPLRLPRASERLDPPLIDILVEDGYRNGKQNRPEADCIVSEIRKIADDPAMAKRTVGVTTLLGQEQAKHIYDKIQDEIGTEIIERHDIRVGDPTAFQGDERDIMFVSLVAQRGDIALSGSAYDQRFNVAASRARNRMILVRSVDLGDLKPADKLRRALIEHFRAPFANEAAGTGSRRERCESDFEREMFDLLVARGFHVDTQVRVGNFRIDLVVEGENDRRLAIECDGDRFHGPDMWSRDMERQRLLERAGWEVWRCFASRFVRERSAVLDELLMLLETRGIEPMGAEEGWTSRHTEHRRWRSRSSDSDEQSATVEERAVDEAKDVLPADEAPAASPDPGSRADFPFVTDQNPDAYIFENGRRTPHRPTKRRVAVDLFDRSGDEGDHPSDAPEHRTTESEIQLAILYVMTDGAEWTNGELKRVLDESFPLTAGDRMQAAHRPNERKWEELVDNALSPSRGNSLTSRALVRTVSRGHHVLTDEGRALIEAKIAKDRGAD
ncbi:very-short-patch-repair endonuclease [Sphingomonas zeicaulis]|uniref:AAA domain-containing protein n=1 Tax=Sphingomonas zeicaulis TaxID=1632740 RepID=UPI003D20A387